MSRPNILLIVTDQERYDVVGANGAETCRTPHLDGLADEGARFSHAFVPSALCSPSRASLLTGLFPHSHGILNNTHGPDALRDELDPDVPTFPRMLAASGYRTGFVGKWHAGRSGPEGGGFHEVHSEPYDVARAEEDRDLSKPVRARFPHDTMTLAGTDPRPVVDTEAYQDTTAALDMLKRLASGDAPFLLRVDYEGPHHPYMPPEPYASLYDPASLSPWGSFGDDLSAKPPIQARLLSQRGVEGFRWEDWQRAIALYLGYVTFLDAQIGRLLEALDELGLGDDTVVIHTADHGDMTGSHGGQFNKGPLMYDELYRVPLLVRGPGVTPGTAEGLVSTIDLMPTIVELAGLQPPPGLAARSLLPLLEDPRRPGREAVFAEFHGDEWGLYSQRMVRTRSAKYVYSPRGVDELYDLDSDPHELTNLIDRPEAEPLRADLAARLVEWMRDTGDPLWGWARRILP